MIMLKSIAARSSWRSPVITVKQASETTSAALRVKKACSDILSDALSRKSHQSLQFFGAVIPSDLHVPVNSAVVHSKNTRLAQFVFYIVICKNSRVFMSHNSAEFHCTFHSKILY